MRFARRHAPPPADPVIEPESFVRRHQKALWRFLQVCGCDAQVAEDLAQEALWVALRKGLAWPNARAESAWLRKTARRSVNGSAFRSTPCATC